MDNTSKVFDVLLGLLSNSSNEDENEYMYFHFHSKNKKIMKNVIND